MQKIRDIAFMCVGRAVFFGTLAITLIMLSLAFHPVASFKAGALLSLVMAAVLLFFAMTASKRPARKTEVWLYLDEASRPINDHAQKAFSTLMREVYGIYAHRAFNAAVGLFVVAMLLQLFGVTPIYR